MASIAAIESMDHRDATKLRKAGIRTTDALLKTAATRTGRRRLARDTDLSEGEILAWVNRADLMRIKGIGSEYADLLEAAGVDSCTELAQRNPANLAVTFQEVDAARPNWIRRLPSETMVTGWVQQAKTLPKVVTH